jgi:hypothetical protein
MLSSAGAQTGDLIFYSTKPLGAGVSENCSISSVQALGDNLWKVSVKGRTWNSKQQVNLIVK